MTAKEQLRQRVESLTEEEAAETLRLLDELVESLRPLSQRADPALAAFREAPIDDEPVTPEEEAAVAEANADIAAGRLVSLDEILAEFGD